MEVRHQFAVKVHQMVQDFQKDPTKGHKAAKWAAVFPLAAMDPTQANCQAAFTFLMEFVAVRRWTSLSALALSALSAICFGLFCPFGPFGRLSLSALSAI
jgi:hypothetical protein